MAKSWKQQKRQETRARGKYSKLNPCYICGKGAGADYYSDHRTDADDSAGNHWGDEALCLCERCATKLADLPDNTAYQIANHLVICPWLPGTLEKQIENTP